MPYDCNILLFYRQYKEHLVTLFFFYASINVKPEGEGGICGAFDFSEEFWVKILTVGPQKLVKSDQKSPGV